MMEQIQAEMIESQEQPVEMLEQLGGENFLAEPEQDLSVPVDSVQLQEQPESVDTEMMQLGEVPVEMQQMDQLQPTETAAQLEEQPAPVEMGMEVESVEVENVQTQEPLQTGFEQSEEQMGFQQSEEQ